MHYGKKIHVCIMVEIAWKARLGCSLTSSFPWYDPCTVVSGINCPFSLSCLGNDIIATHCNCEFLIFNLITEFYNHVNVSAPKHLF